MLKKMLNNKKTLISLISGIVVVVVLIFCLIFQKQQEETSPKKPTGQVMTEHQNDIDSEVTDSEKNKTNESGLEVIDSGKGVQEKSTPLPENWETDGDYKKDENSTVTDDDHKKDENSTVTDDDNNNDENIAVDDDVTWSDIQ